MKGKRHKWDMNLARLRKRDGNNGGGVAECIKCGCVKEYIKGVPTYFINDTLCNYSPDCIPNYESLTTVTPSNHSSKEKEND